MTRKSTSLIKLGGTSKSTSFAYNIRELTVIQTTRRAQKAKPKLTGSNNQAQSAKGAKNNLKVSKNHSQSEKGLSKSLKAQIAHAQSAKDAK